jgi:uncharacterized protein (TIGR04222 family)
MQLFSSWTGSDFLAFYSGLLVASCFAAWWIPSQLRDPGRRGGSPDAESVALLAGGRDRFADSVLAALFVQEALGSWGKEHLTVVRRDVACGSAGKALLAAEGPFTRREARRIIDLHAERIAALLRRSGLLMWPDQHTRLRWLSITPFAALFLIGLYRQRAGSALGEPTGFLVILLGLTVVLAVIRFVRSDPRTAAGVAAVSDLRTRNSRIARAPRPEEAPLAVALFGTGVLVGTPWEPVHALRERSGDGGSAGSDDGSDGGSGCGGGGCGGCGG